MVSLDIKDKIQILNSGVTKNRNKQEISEQFAEKLEKLLVVSFFIN